jgi:hypothetical protein
MTTCAVLYLSTEKRSFKDLSTNVQVLAGIIVSLEVLSSIALFDVFVPLLLNYFSNKKKTLKKF